MNDIVSGALVFTNERSAMGYRINKLAMALTQPTERDRMKADEEGFMAEHGQWSLYLELRGLDSGVPRWLSSWRGDGIIVRTGTPAMAASATEMATKAKWYQMVAEKMRVSPISNMRPERATRKTPKAARRGRGRGRLERPGRESVSARSAPAAA